MRTSSSTGLRWTAQGASLTITRQRLGESTVLTTDISTFGPRERAMSHRENNSEQLNEPSWSWETRFDSLVTLQPLSYLFKTGYRIIRNWTNNTKNASIDVAYWPQLTTCYIRVQADMVTTMTEQHPRFYFWFLFFFPDCLSSAQTWFFHINEASIQFEEMKKTDIALLIKLSNKHWRR